MPKQKKKKLTQVKRRQMIQEVFNKGKKQREIAKKFDEKLSRKQGSGDKNKFQQLKKVGKLEKNFNRDQVAKLDKEFDRIRATRIAGESTIL